MKDHRVSGLQYAFLELLPKGTQRYTYTHHGIFHTHCVNSANTVLFKKKVFWQGICMYGENAHTWEIDQFTVVKLHIFDYFPHFLPYILLNQELLNLCPCRGFNLIKAHSQERQILYLVSKCSLILSWCCCIMDAYFTLTFQSVFFS